MRGRNVSLNSKLVCLSRPTPHAPRPTSQLTPSTRAHILKSVGAVSVVLRTRTIKGGTHRMDNDKAVGTLNDLIETLRDGQNGFKEAAENAKDANLKTFFNQV